AGKRETKTADCSASPAGGRVGLPLSNWRSLAISFTRRGQGDADTAGVRRPRRGKKGASGRARGGRPGWRAGGDKGDTPGPTPAPERQPQRRPPGLPVQLFMAVVVGLFCACAGIEWAANALGPGALWPGALCGAALGAGCGFVIPPALVRLALYLTPNE